MQSKINEHHGWIYEPLSKQDQKIHNKLELGFRNWELGSWSLGHVNLQHMTTYNLKIQM
jgi:hypothetical protein